MSARRFLICLALGPPPSMTALILLASSPMTSVRSLTSPCWACSNRISAMSDLVSRDTVSPGRTKQIGRPSSSRAISPFSSRQNDYGGNFGLPQKTDPKINYLIITIRYTIYHSLVIIYIILLFDL